MKHTKIDLEHEVPDYGGSIVGEKPNKVKKEHPTVHIYHGKMPKGMKPGHKVVLHGVVTEVNHRSSQKDGEDPEEEDNVGIKLHHMEHHGEAEKPHKGEGASDEADIEEGLSESENTKKGREARIFEDNKE